MESVSLFACIHCSQKIEPPRNSALSTAACPRCRKEILIPGRLGNFLLQAKAGAGTMGVVYRALDEALRRTVAVKILYGDSSEDSAAHVALLREARAVAALKHPNVVSIYQLGLDAQRSYLVMEWLSGGSLADRMTSGAAMPETEVLRIAETVFQALERCQAINLVHGDLKPSNLLFDEGDVLKLSDFGIAHFGCAEWKKDIRGTPLYIAPEKARGQMEDFRSDLYSMAAILYHLAAGRPPFDHDDPMELVRMRYEAQPPSLQEINPAVSLRTSSLLGRLLHPDPAQRPAHFPTLFSEINRAVDYRSRHPAKNRRPRRFGIF